MGIAERVRECRKALGWTQAKLAVELGVSTTAVAGWEQGSGAPDMGPCIKLAFLSEGELAWFFAERAGIPEEHRDYYNRIAHEGLRELARSSTSADTAIARRPAKLSRDRATLRKMLDVIVDSGDDDAIEAITHNLHFFSRHVGKDQVRSIPGVTLHKRVHIGSHPAEEGASRDENRTAKRRTA